MIETLLNPLYFAALVSMGLLVGICWNGRWEGFRPFLFLGINALLLATWFGGKWQGVTNCLLIASLFYVLIHLSKLRPKIWLSSLIALIILLALAKYDYPTWLPHVFRGGIWLRKLKAFFGIPSLEETIGVSYLCFRLIHVLVDYSNGNLPKLKFLSFLNYTLFAASSIAGPINRFENFTHNLSHPSPLSGTDFFYAICRIVVGLSKKILIAGLISPYALGSLEPAGPHAAFLLLIACVCYSLYIYADFSGYTDIAIGLGRLFGIVLPENFNRPYLAPTVQEFWNRWHMSLTTWIKTYIFFPLNLWLTRRYTDGAKTSNPVISILIAFALIGIWHGNAWNFLAFGLFHGLGISTNMILRRYSKPSTQAMTMWEITWRRIVTFSFVSFSWIFFVYPLEDIPWLFNQILH